MNTLLVFLILSFIVVALFYKRENVSFFTNKFNGNVHIRGKAQILTDSNKKIKCDKLCIKDSLTGKVSCIEPDKLMYLLNNKDHRLKMICLGNTCINKNHIDILKGQQTFKLANLNTDRCLGNYGRKIPIRGIHDDNDDCSHDVVNNALAYTDCSNNKSIDFNLADSDTTSSLSQKGSSTIGSNVDSSFNFGKRYIRGDKIMEDTDVVSI